MDVIYKKIEEYNPNKKRKILLAFYDMIADIPTNNKLNPIITGLFIRGRKLDIFLIFITQYYFVGLKHLRLNSMHFFILKNPNKQEVQQIALNHLSDIDFRDFMNLYKTCNAKSYLFLVIDATFASDNYSRFRKNLLKRILKLIMTIDDKIRDKKLQYNINREAAKISTLSSGKIDKYKYLTDEEILPSGQRRVIEQAKFTYSPIKLQKNKEK